MTEEDSKSELKDATSEQVTALLDEARGVVAEAKKIFDEEVTPEHRSQWPNTFRLENATVHTQKTLMIVDPTITQEGAARELLAAAQQARDAIRAAVDNGGGDLIGSADRLLTAISQITLRQPPEDANVAATSAVKELDRLNAEIDERRSALQAASEELEQAQESFETRGRTLTRFLDELTNVAAEVEFQKQAKDYEKESKFFWKAGLLTLIVAACVALLPLLLNYLDRNDHDLDGQSFVSAHLAVALAFAAVSGVLLARARNRDRSRQRNRDLSVALITMFAYSEQIANDDERERFKHDMGRLVLEAFLRHEPPGEDRSNSVLGDLIPRSASGTPAREP